MKIIKGGEKMKKVLGFGVTLIVPLLIFLIINTPYHEPLGEVLLERIGTGGGKEFHLPMFYVFLIILIGLNIVRDFLYANYPKSKGRVWMIVIGLVFCWAFLIDGMIVFNKSIQEGVNSIGFIADESGYNYKVSNNELIEFEGTVTLKNYSNQDKAFYMMCYIHHFRDDIFTQGEFWEYEVDQDSPRKIIVPAKTTRKVTVDFKTGIMNDIPGEDESGRGIIDFVKLYDEDSAVMLDGINIWGYEVDSKPEINRGR